VDPITTAILAAIAGGVVAGASKIGEQAIVDAYNKLKDLLKHKFGARSAVIKAVKALEAKPDSTARKESLRKVVVAAKADRDADLLQVAQLLLDKLNVGSGPSQVSQTALGDGNIQIAGSSHTVNVNVPKHS